MITIIIGGFFALVLVGAIADALLLEKSKSNPWIRYCLAAIPSPYNIMRLYAKMGDNLNDFTRAHAVSGLGYLGIMLIVAAFAWWADQQVLYGLEFTATRDASYSWWQSVGIATIIQAILIFNGGMAMKLWINGSRKDSEHNVQFKIHTLLAVIAFSSTVWLSFQTYELAETRGIQAEAVAKSDVREENKALEGKYTNRIKELRATFSADSLAVAVKFEEKVRNAQQLFAADSARKEAAFESNPTVEVRRYVNSRVGAYRKRKALAEGKALQVKQKALDSLSNVYGPQFNTLESGKTTMLSTLATKLKKTEGSVDKSVDKNANSTRGKNLLLNIIALFFNLGLQFFNRGANKAERLKRESAQAHAQDQDAGVKIPIVGGFEAAKKDLGEQEIKLPKTPQKVEPKQKAPQGNTLKGGTIEANLSVEVEMIDGQPMVKYYGSKGDEWWSWSDCRAAFKNRVNKFKKAKSDKSRKTQLAWIAEVIEPKMSELERLGAGKSKRIKFDSNKPNKELFK